MTQVSEQSRLHGYITARTLGRSSWNDEVATAVMALVVNKGNSRGQAFQLW